MDFDQRDILAVRRAAHPDGEGDGYASALMSAIGDSRIVLLGEASHGTHEFYAERASITRRLIEDKGFSAVVVEADWPDAWRVNRYIRGFRDDADADAALSGFARFPQWMWRNEDVLEFIARLRDHNDATPPRRPKVGFYGMDLYSLHASIAGVLEYLERVDPGAARRARIRYGCFDRFGSPQGYGYAAAMDPDFACEDEVVRQLIELRRNAAEYARRDGRVAEDDYFYAEQNARLVLNAERYYRTMYRGSTASWNLRDQHMAQTLDALIAYLDAHPDAGQSTGMTKVVVWAHNSHLGDARATEPGREGQLNVGQLVRQRWGDAAFLLGFTTHEGSVTAASDWDGPAERKIVRPSLPGSYERLLHDTGLERFLLLLREEGPARSALLDERLERAIGVIYQPRTERQSHYFGAILPEQFDAVIHHDVTSAVVPLEQFATVRAAEPPETYPTGK